MEQNIKALRTQLWNYYTEHGRHDLPWRVAEASGQLDPYKILVSELMLQQTQVPRVVPKFNEFIAAFPTFKALAAADLADVLRAWSGLGYNRRAKFLWQTAQMVVGRFGGELPRSCEELVRLPGIGPNTAGAILAYAFNQPTAFVETNIRSVLIHHFFAGQEKVSDKEIVAVLERLLAAEASPREFYWALMDYGTFLKQTSGNAARKSAGYVRQSAFNGSRRQVRGKVLRALHAQAKSSAELAAEIDDERLQSVLDDLRNEGMISLQNNKYQL